LLQYWAWRAASAILRRLPARAAYALADACGRVAFACWPRARLATQRNFRRVLPELPACERRSVARRSLQLYCRYLADFARLPADDRVGIMRLCEPGVAFEQLRCAAAGRGAIIVPMHFGNWDIGAAAAVADGFQLTAVGDRFGDSRLDDAVFGARERLGMRIVAAGSPSPALLRPLRRGGLLALLIDRPTPGTGITVPFFGKPVEVPSGPARLALRTGAAVVPCAFPRLDAASARVGVLADFSIDTRSTGDREADVRRIPVAIMAAHERYIRCYPEQWYLFREMWPATVDPRQ